jgi:N-acetylneuraminic acid mutarotase
MAVARSGQTATLLRDDEVLIAGGGTSSAELYDPSSGTFSLTASMSVSRTDATATLLRDGDVLVVGGLDGNHQLSTAELYDPRSGAWSLTGSMAVARSGQTATMLADGEVLVAGGGCNGSAYGCNAGSFLGNLRSAELYDPSTGTWSSTGPMHEGRQNQTATLLSGGDVLVAGGFVSCDDDFCLDTATAELYDPSTGRWATTGSMRGPREQFTATLLGDGDVLVAGGLNAAEYNPVGMKTADLYDPTTGTWTTTASMSYARYGQTATLLRDGSVLVAGGTTGTAEIYEPAAGIWAPPGAMSTVRTDQTATLLPGGHVLVTGGTGPDGVAQTTAEIFLAGPGPLVTVAPLTLSFGGQQVGTTSASETYTVTNRGSADLLASGVDVEGGDPGDFTASTDCNAAPVTPGGTCTVYVHFTPAFPGLRGAIVAVADNAPLSPQEVAVNGYGGGPDAWVPVGSMTAARDEFAGTLLSDGDVLIAGGGDGFETSLATAELYDPITQTFAPTGPLSTPRSFPTAILLPGGDVLVAGGLDSDTLLSSAELYDPTPGTWSPTGSMLNTGYGLASTLLPSGMVLVTGYGSSAELYDPTTGIWSATGAMSASHVFGADTLLPDGEVLCAGGDSAVTELYDPSTNSWTATGALNVARVRATATLLPDGQVLMAGGIGPTGGDALASAELYDPSTGKWTLTGSMNVGSWGQTATLLADGTVVVAGGCTGGCERGLSSAEVYLDGYWYFTRSMTEPRLEQTAVLLRDGDLLVAGGDSVDGGLPTATAEVYTPTVLFANPTSGLGGTHVRLQGSGFYAGEQVQVTWDNSKVLATVTSSASGTIVATVVVPKSANPGDHTITARGESSFAPGNATFHVT